MFCDYDNCNYAWECLESEEGQGSAPILKIMGWIILGCAHSIRACVRACLLHACALSCTNLCTRARVCMRTCATMCSCVRILCTCVLACCTRVQCVVYLAICRLLIIVLVVCIAPLLKRSVENLISARANQRQHL